MDMKDKKPLTTDFKDTSYGHHAMVGQAPEGRGAAYRFAVAAGNLAITTGALTCLAVRTIVSARSRDLD